MDLVSRRPSVKWRMRGPGHKLKVVSGGSSSLHLCRVSFSSNLLFSFIQQMFTGFLLIVRYCFSHLSRTEPGP